GDPRPPDSLPIGGARSDPDSSSDCENVRGRTAPQKLRNQESTMRVGVIGCGNISDIYVANSKLFKDVDFVACADIVSSAADRLSAKFGLRKLSVPELLGGDVEIILNLTIPAAHAEISQAAIAAGKHVYTEKPLATTLADGAEIVGAAKSRGLR